MGLSTGEVGLGYGESSLGGDGFRLCLGDALIGALGFALGVSLGARNQAFALLGGVPGLRHGLPAIADLGTRPQDRNKHRNEHQAPAITQIEPMRICSRAA